MVTGIKELLQAYEGTPAELSSETGQAPTPTVTLEGLVKTVKDFSPAGDIENIVEAGKSFQGGRYGEGLLKTAEGGLPLLLGVLGSIINPGVGAITYGATKAAVKGGKKAVEDILQYSNKQDISEKIPTKWYRGTNNVGETINPAKWKNTQEGVLGGGGIYVTPDPEAASRYAVEGWEGTRTSGGFVTPLDVDFKNPLIIELNNDIGYYAEREALIQLGVPAKKAEKIAEKALENKGGFTTELKKRALDAGYDGIILKTDGKIREAIVYNPERTIKSSITKKKKGGSLVERNPYSNYKPKVI